MKSLILAGLLAISSYGASQSFILHSVNNYEKSHKLGKAYKNLPLMSKFYVKEFNKDLTLKQQNLLINVYLRAKKYNLKYTLTAIAWKESNAGAIPVNVFDPSCGVFHNNLKVVGKSVNNFIPSKYNYNKLCNKLITDTEFSMDQAVRVIRYFQKYYHNNWMKIWGAYNGGFHPNKKYAKDIWYRIKAIKYVTKKIAERNPTFE